MPDPSDANPELLPPRLLVKLRPSPALRAAERRAKLQPLHDTEAAERPCWGSGPNLSGSWPSFLTAKDGSWPTAVWPINWA